MIAKRFFTPAQFNASRNPKNHVMWVLGYSGTDRHILMNPLHFWSTHSILYSRSASEADCSTCTCIQKQPILLSETTVLAQQSWETVIQRLFSGEKKGIFQIKYSNPGRSMLIIYVNNLAILFIQFSAFHIIWRSNKINGTKMKIAWIILVKAILAVMT